jgi:molecular chaperone DnaJ
MSVLRSPARGDMFVEIAVETPANLTRKQRELLEQFDAESRANAKTSPESEGFFARVKEFFDGGRD